MRCAVIDVEGNGQQPQELVEIAVAPITGGVIGQPASWLIRPARPITPVATRWVHGISDLHVANAPSFDMIAPQLRAALKERVPVAHNAHVEYRALRRHLPGWSPPLMLCTLKLAKHVWPGLVSYRLDALVAHARTTVDNRYGQRHRAAHRAYATAFVFLALAAGNTPTEVATWGGIQVEQPRPEGG